MQKQKGFTLIELLVVIAIIALLLSIIIPSLKKATLAAEEVMCRSNLKQYGLAGKMYMEDNNSRFPNAWDSIFRSRDEPGHNRICQWHDAVRHPDIRPDLQGTLWDYIGGGTGVHYCRTFARFARTGNPHPGHNDLIPIEPLFCYSMNGFLGGFEAGVTPRLIVNISQVTSPATTFFFAEENCWPYSPSPSDPYYPRTRYQETLNDNALCGSRAHPRDATAWTDSREMGPPYLDAFGSFHKTTIQRRNEGMANAVFVDGHVKLVEPDRTYYYTKPMHQQPPLR